MEQPLLVGAQMCPSRVGGWSPASRRDEQARMLGDSNSTPSIIPDQNINP